jgi:hypothetical protein
MGGTKKGKNSKWISLNSLINISVFQNMTTVFMTGAGDLEFKQDRKQLRPKIEAWVVASMPQRHAEVKKLIPHLHPAERDP